jgi:hypothetical protein
MSEFPDELGWIEFPGSERAAWARSSSPSAGSGAPAPDGAGGAVPGRAFKRGLVFTRGRHERARREATAEWRRQRMAAIRERSLKSGVITMGSGFGGTGKTDVAVTLAAIYAAARPADRVIFADTNDAMPHGYSRLGGAPVEEMPRHRRPLSIRGFHHACLEGGIRVYADLRDAVAWLQGVAVIRGDTADECAGADFGEQEYLTVLEVLQRMSNIVINDGGTGLFTRLQAGTLLHADKYVFVTEASQLGFWSIGQVFSRYRNYEGEKDRPLTEQEMKHLNGLIDEATVVVASSPKATRSRSGGSLRSVRVLRRRECRWWRRPGISRSPTACRWILALWRARRSMPSWRWPTWCCTAPTALTTGVRASLMRRRQKTGAMASRDRPSRHAGSRSLCHRLLACTAPTLSRTPLACGSSPPNEPLTARPSVRSPRLVARTPQTLSRTPRTCRSSPPNEPLTARPSVRSPRLVSRTPQTGGLTPQTCGLSPYEPKQTAQTLSRRFYRETAAR